MERLIWQRSVWGAGDTSLPIHLMVRTDEGLLYPRTHHVTRYGDGGATALH
jgi:hypothetical protein